MSYLGPNQPEFNLIAHFCTASAQITKKFDYLPLDSLARSLLPKTSAAMSQSSLPPTLRIKFRYANTLRCIGQSLESVDLKALELKLQGDTYVVQAWHRGTSSSMNFERQYSLEDIKKLEIEGREKRHSFPGPVNLLSLSQVLRLAGNYVDCGYGPPGRGCWREESRRS